MHIVYLINDILHHRYCIFIYLFSFLEIKAYFKGFYVHFIFKSFLSFILSSKKGIDGLTKKIEAVIVPIFCFATDKADEDKYGKLNKVERGNLIN